MILIWNSRLLHMLGKTFDKMVKVVWLIYLFEVVWILSPTPCCVSYVCRDHHVPTACLHTCFTQYVPRYLKYLGYPHTTCCILSMPMCHIVSMVPSSYMVEPILLLCPFLCVFNTSSRYMVLLSLHQALYHIWLLLYSTPNITFSFPLSHIFLWSTLYTYYILVCAVYIWLLLYGTPNITLLATPGVIYSFGPNGSPIMF